MLCLPEENRTNGRTKALLYLDCASAIAQRWFTQPYKFRWNTEIKIDKKGRVYGFSLHGSFPRFRAW